MRAHDSPLRRALTAVVLLLTWRAIPALAQDIARQPDMPRRGADLPRRLEEGQPIRLTAFGDSLTAGWGTDGRHVYHSMFADALRHRFPQCDVQLSVHGHPGETTEDALLRARPEVIPDRPDLILVQFGGNDHGWGRPLGAFGRDLRTLLDLLARETGALVIACLPPMSDPNPDNLWSAAARAVAAEAGVPAADLDRAIRQGDGDHRGPFPYGSHPGSFTHVIMAREVLRAFDAATGTTPPFTCDLLGAPALSSGRQYEVQAEVGNLTPDALSCTVEQHYRGNTTRTEVTVGPRDTLALRQLIPLPVGRMRDRSFSVPIELRVAGDGYSSFDVGWLVVAPAMRVSVPREGEDGPANPRWHTIGADALVLGRHLWLGEDDLSGRFAAIALPDQLRFAIAVTDDDLTVASLQDPSQGDSVELYLDLRGDRDQGKPIYSPDVLALQVIPPTEQGTQPQWRTMHELPGDLTTIAVSAELTERGYDVEIDVPLAAVQARRGEDWSGLGFDIGINDADYGATRKSQMMWAGTPDNYLNPAYLAGLYLGPVPTGAVRMTLR